VAPLDFVLDLFKNELPSLAIQARLKFVLRRAHCRPNVEVLAISPVSDLMQVWMDQWSRGVRPDDIVVSIEARFRAATGQDRYDLAAQLNTFLTIAYRDEERLQLLNQMMKEFPDDVELPMNKAEVYLHLSEDSEALKWIDVAIERAKRQRRFQREMLGYKARILLKLGRGDELSDVLESIMAIRLEKGAIDIGRERDFIDRAPPGMIRKDVLDRYNEFRPKRSTDTSADELPKYEPPEAAME